MTRKSQIQPQGYLLLTMPSVVDGHWPYILLILTWPVTCYAMLLVNVLQVNAWQVLYY